MVKEHTDCKKFITKKLGIVRKKQAPVPEHDLLSSGCENSSLDHIPDSHLIALIFRAIDCASKTSKVSTSTTKKAVCL